MSARFSAEPVARLIDEFNKLPSIGPKSAARLTYHLLRTGPEATQALIEALTDLKERIVFCTVCFNITEANHNPCPICDNPERDRSLICVVEGRSTWSPWSERGSTRGSITSCMA
jgi:recombination protein RecR